MRDGNRLGRMVVLAMTVWGAAGMAWAAGEVEAIAGTETVTLTGPGATMATADNSGMFATTTRSVSQVSGAVAGALTPDRVPASARAFSEFSIVGLAGSVPLTFHWTFAGSRDGELDNTGFRSTMRVTLNGPGFVDIVSWGISYADSTPNTGDFAGTAQSAFGVSAAGNNFSNQLPAGHWDGIGSRMVTTTMVSATSGMAGSFALFLDIGLAGQVSASHSLQLSAVTVADPLQLDAGAHLLLDDGSQIMISAVPEPSTWAMMLAGVVLMGRYARRRTRSA